MPIFSPRPFQKAYLPVEREPKLPARAFTMLERTAKGALFGCRMCGNCILQETAFICPMTCAKGLRNGFCGEATDERCVVDASRPCTWRLIFERSQRMGRVDKLLEVNAPINGAQAGHSAWLPFVKFWRERGQPALGDLLTNREKFWLEWDGLCYDFRQPDWWQGDADYHPPAYQTAASRLEMELRQKTFIVTAEIEPPGGSETKDLRKKCNLLNKHVVSINFSDNAFATSRMSSLACCLTCLEAGGEAVMQIQARDRSRNGILSDVIGASALGVRNILCLGGDYHNKTPQVFPAQPEQFDIDAVQMLWMLRRLRDEGKMPDGREVEDRPRYFLGAAGAPFTLKPEWSALRMEKKINAGAQFVQTQMVFDIDAFGEWMDDCASRGLTEKAAFLAGVYPLRSAEEAHFLAEEPGVSIPQETLQRMEAAYARDSRGCAGACEHQLEEGRQIAVELMHRLREMPGVRGVHLMVGGQEAVVPVLLKEAGW